MMTSMKHLLRISGVLAGICIMILAVADVSRAAEGSKSFTPPAQLNDGWPVKSLSRAGLDLQAMVRLTQSIKNGDFPNTHALLISHAGHLVYEAYFEGKDERWGEPLGHVVFQRDTLHDLRSVTKSITSILLGIALADEIPEALDRPVAHYFSHLKGSLGTGVDRITLRNVLTMTAGLQWNEMTTPYTNPKNDEIRLYHVPDPVAMVLHRPVEVSPGKSWYYNGGLTQVLGGVIRAKTGKLPHAYAQEVLFSPLGIVAYEWLGSPVWRPRGLPSAASGLRMRARDLARIGSMMRQDGRWQGKQVVPGEWVRLSTQRHVADIGSWGHGGVYGYGFQWRHGNFKSPFRYTAITAVGNGDQRLFILPEQQMVVTVFAGVYNRYHHRNGERILKEIMSALRR